MASWHGLKEGDEVELEITGKTRDGRGAGRIGGLIVFVDGGSVGEKVKVRIVRMAARHAYGEIVQRLSD